MNVNNPKGDTGTPAAAVEKKAVRSGAVDRLTPAAAKLAGASISDNTRRAYQSALDRVQAFLQAQGQDLAGLADRPLAEYLGALHEAGAAPASAALACAAVRFLAKTTGQPSPAGPLTGRVLAGIRRKGKDRGRGQVAPASSGPRPTPPPPSPPTGTRTSRGFGTRRSSPSCPMVCSGSARPLPFRWSTWPWKRTGRPGSPSSTARRTRRARARSCSWARPPLDRLRAWMTAPPGSSRVRCFAGSAGAGWGVDAPLSTQAVRRIIKRRAAAAGLEGHFSGHSLRVGSAQSLASQGASLVEMQNAGRWQSPAMPGHYARGEFAARGAVARLRYGK